MNTHIIIPARLNSTRLPKKALLNIHKKPMILWTAQKAKQAVEKNLAGSYCVATDHHDIYDLCQKNGINAMMTSPNCATGTDRLAHAADILGLDDEDVVLNLQGDEPLVPMALFAQLTQLLLGNADCTMATLCKKIDDASHFLSPSVVKVVFAKQKALYFSRAPIPYCRADANDFTHAYRHLGLYAYKVQLLRQFGGWYSALEDSESLEQLRILQNGHQIAIDTACADLPIGVDTMEDLVRLNAMDYDAFMRLSLL